MVYGPNGVPRLMTSDDAAALRAAIMAAIDLADAGEQLLVAALLQQAHDMVEAA